jgi:Flp pilus assembly protein TadG
MREAVRLGENERGAVKIQTVVILLLVLIVAFVAIKITPVYVEQQKVIHEVDELARISAVRNYKEDKVAREVTKLVGDFGLSEDNISFNIKDRRVKITVNYKREIDLLVTNYTWQVAHEVEGKEL